MCGGTGSVKAVCTPKTLHRIAEINEFYGYPASHPFPSTSSGQAFRQFVVAFDGFTEDVCLVSLGVLLWGGNALLAGFLPYKDSFTLIPQKRIDYWPGLQRSGYDSKNHLNL